MEPLAVSPCTLGPIELSTVYSGYFSQTCSGVMSGKMMFLGNKSTWITPETPTNKQLKLGTIARLSPCVENPTSRLVYGYSIS